MKKLCILMLCLVIFSLCFPVEADAQSLTEQAAEAVGLGNLEESLTEEERVVGGSLDLTGGYDAAGALSRLWQMVLDSFLKSLHAQFSFAASLLALIFLCALADGVTANTNAKNGIVLAACCTAAALTAGDWDSGIAQATQTLSRLSDYSRAALPVIYTAAAASGSMGSAPIRYASCCLAMEVLMTVSSQLVLPMIYAYLALAVSGSITENALLRAVQRLIRWITVTLLAGLTMVFCLYISLTGLVAGSADALAVKAAKTVIASVLPVVGGILSDSAATLLSAAGVIRSTAGVFSMIAVCTVCAGPVLFLALKMLLLRAASTMAELLPGGRLSRLLDECASAFGMLLGLVGSCSAMLFFSLMAGMKAVSGT